MKYDWVIRDALIIDGRGGAPTFGDVGVSGGRIASVGLVEGSGRIELDAKRRALSPGFIDAHAHDDFSVFVDPTMAHKVLQGVTTSVVGNCGIGAAPKTGARDWIEMLHPGAHMPTWDNYSQYVARVEEAGPSIHLAVLAGHGSMRAVAAAGATRKLTSAELGRLMLSYEEAIEAGVFGLSSGLIYEPGCHADEDELVALLKVGRSAAPLYATHLRNESGEVVSAVQEALRVARAAGVGLELSHHKAHGRNNWGKVKETLALVDAAVGAGEDVWLDVYPYVAGSTVLKAVAADIEMGENSRVGQLLPEDLVISGSARRPELVGKNLAEIMRENAMEKAEAVRYLLREDDGIWVILFAMSEEDVKTVLSHPRALVGSDGLPLSGGKPHPRLFGTFPRVLGRYSREEQLFSLSEAVAKMTFRTAQRFGIRDRGSVSVGMVADLVLFEPDVVLDGATFDAPRTPPLGVTDVWVNGVHTLRDGQHTGARAGGILRRNLQPQLSLE